MMYVEFDKEKVLDFINHKIPNRGDLVLLRSKNLRDEDRYGIFVSMSGNSEFDTYWKVASVDGIKDYNVRVWALDVYTHIGEAVG